MSTQAPGLFVKGAAEVPQDLKQCLTLVPGSHSTISDNIFEDKTSEVRVRHLFKSNGQPTVYQVLFTANEFAIRDVNRNRIYCQFSFESGVNIKEIVYLPTDDGRFGVAVAYNEGTQETGCLARLVRTPSLRIVQKLTVPHKISAIRVLIGDDEEKPKIISKRMKQWVNVLAVGTYNGHGYIISLPVDYDWEDEMPPVVKSLTDGLGSFQRDGKTFTYRPPRNPGQECQEIRKPLKDVYVSAIGYITRSCVVLLGMSFGGIVQVSISNDGDIRTNVISSGTPIRHLVGMLPHDDPNMHVWFWSMTGSSDRGLRMVLYEGFYDLTGQEHLPAVERDLQNPQFMPKCMEAFPKGSKWLTVQPLVRERRYGTRDDADETANVTLNDTDLDYSQMFYALLSPENQLICGLFDLNTYYFKRLLQYAYTDATIARQCPFLSIALGPHELPISAEEITDLAVDCAQMSKFRFAAEDPEQQLYISSMNALCINGGSTSSTFKLKMASLPSQVLEKVYGKQFPKHARKPQGPVRKLIAVGVMPQLSGLEHQTEFATLMTGAILYGKLSIILKMIKETTDEEWSFLRNVSEWMWSEVARARTTLDAMVELLFSDMCGMSGDQRRQLTQVFRTVNAAKKIFDKILNLLESWQKEGVVPRGVAAEVEVRLVAVKNLADYVNCIMNLVHSHFLPMGERSKEERRDLEEGVAARRRTSQEPLLIDRAIQRIQTLAPDEPFWLDQTATEWYPPALHNGVSVLLPLTLPDKIKKEFIIYFMIDLVVARKHLGFGKPFIVYEEVPSSVTQLLDDVLKVNKKDVLYVFHHWCEETKVISSNSSNGSLPVLNASPGVENADSKITELVKRADFLSSGEEKELKSLCLTAPFGKYRWQLYLLQKGRFTEVEILDTPSSTNSNVYQRLYAESLPGIRRVKEYIKSWDERMIKAPTLSREVLDKMKQFDPEKKESSRPANFNNAKTPISLFKRIRRVPRTSPKESAESVVPDEDTMSPEPKRKKPDFEDFSTPEPRDLQPGQLEQVATILRTPTSRRARAAAAVECQAGIALTPECEAAIPQPTSILRTPIPMSPSRGRIRWDPEFVEDSSMSSAEPAEANETANDTLDIEDGEESDRDKYEDSMEELTEDEEEDEKEVSFEEQEEEAPLEDEEMEKEIEEQENSSDEPEGEETEKVFDEQEEEDEVEVIKALEEQDDVLNETEPSGGEEAFKQVKLVDYSICDSTMNETPTRVSANRRWFDEDGLEHSYEEQPDESSNTPKKVTREEEDLITERTFEVQEDNGKKTMETSFEDGGDEEEEESPLGTTFVIDPPTLSSEETTDEGGTPRRRRPSEEPDYEDSFTFAPPAALAKQEAEKRKRQEEEERRLREEEEERLAEEARIAEEAREIRRKKEEEKRKKEERERLEREKKEEERRKKEEKERLERDRKAEEEKRKKEEERLEKEKKAEEERLKKEKLEQEEKRRKEEERLEKERKAEEEKRRKEEERLEKERKAKEEKERLEQEKKAKEEEERRRKVEEEKELEKKKVEEEAEEAKKRASEEPEPVRRSSRRASSVSTKPEANADDTRAHLEVADETTLRRSTRRSPSRTRGASISEKPSESNAKRTLFTVATEEPKVVEEPAPVAATTATPRKRGRPPKAAPTPTPSTRSTRSSSKDVSEKEKSEEPMDAVSSFKARMAKVKQEKFGISASKTTTTRKRTASDSTLPSYSAKKPVIVPTSISEEVVTATQSKRRRSVSHSGAPAPTRASSRKTEQLTIVEEPEEPAPSARRTPSRTRPKKDEAVVVTAPAPRRTPSRTRKDETAKEKTPEPVATTSKRGRTPQRNASIKNEAPVDVQVKRSPGRPRKTPAVAATAPVTLEVEEPTKRQTPSRRATKK